MSTKREKMDGEGKFYSSSKIRKVEAVYNIVYGKRSRGKTYDMLVHILTDYWNARKEGRTSQGFYLRRYDGDLKGDVPRQMCEMLVFNGYGENFIEKLTDGEFDDVKYWNRCWTLIKTDRETGLVKKDSKPFLFAGALNLWERAKGGSFPHVDTVWLEEFMCDSETAYLPGEFKKFMNYLSTIIRHRTNVTVWLLGNSQDMYCPYFEWFGIPAERVMAQKQGTIDVYKIGKTGKKIAVERTKDSGVCVSNVSNDYYFAFDNPELKMITEGDWEIGMYPLLKEDISQSDVCGRFFIYYKTNVIECDIVSTDAGDVFLYFHRSIDPLDPPDEDVDLIYCQDVSMKWNFRRKLTSPMTPGERSVLTLISSEKMFFDDNITGNAFDSYMKWCRTN